MIDNRSLRDISTQQIAAKSFYVGCYYIYCDEDAYEDKIAFSTDHALHIGNVFVKIILTYYCVVGEMYVHIFDGAAGELW